MRGLIRGDGRPYLGHNPVARLMVSLLILFLVAQAVTGLVLAGTDIFYSPFGYWFASWVAAPSVDPLTLVPYDKTGIDATSWDAMRAFRSPFVTIHYWNFYVLLALIVIHIAVLLRPSCGKAEGLFPPCSLGEKYSIKSRWMITGQAPDRVGQPPTATTLEGTRMATT